MARKMSVIIDSSCSLPTNLINKYHIKRVPLRVSIDGEELVDPCDAAQTLTLFKSGKLSKKHVVTTSPPSPEDFENAITESIEEGSKMVVIQTVNRAQGETYNNANVAVSSIRRKLGDKHREAAIRVMDSRTVFAGQGLMVSETIRRILSGQDPSEVRRLMDNLSSKIHTFVLPREPLLALERAQKRNEKAVGWTQVVVAKALGIHPILCIVNDSSYLAAKGFGFQKSAKQLFNHAKKQIEKGLSCPFVVINYAGSMQELKSLPGFDELKQCADEHKVQLVPSVMSIAGGIYTTVGSLTLALACEPHDWEG